MSKTIYIPAFSTGALNHIFIKNLKHNKTDKSFRFYTKNKNNIINYPYILFSAHYNLQYNVEKSYGVDLKKSLVLGDSGGFQIATGKMEYTDELREKIFLWLENNTTYAIQLDLPPHVSCNNVYTGLFDERMKKSIENFKYFADNKMGKTKFLNVLHGREISLIQKWYDNIKCFNNDFDGGWAVGSAALSTYNILLSLAFLLQNNEFDRLDKRYRETKIKQLVHILGLSKSKDIIFLTYFAKKLNEINLNNIIITYDSSTPQTSGVRGGYMYSWTNEGFKWMKFSNQIKFEKNINYDAKLPCSCPICRTLTLKDLYAPSKKIQDALGPLYYGYICMHNFIKILEFKRFIQKSFDSNSQLIYDSFLNSSMLTILKIIDKMFEQKDKAINVILQNKKVLKSHDDFIRKNNSINNLF